MLNYTKPPAHSRMDGLQPTRALGQEPLCATNKHRNKHTSKAAADDTRAAGRSTDRCNAAAHLPSSRHGKVHHSTWVLLWVLDGAAMGFGLRPSVCLLICAHRRIKKSLDAEVKALKPEDRVLIIGNSREPFDNFRESFGADRLQRKMQRSTDESD